jgi:hypothetical protein
MHDHELEFITSLTVCPSDIQKISTLIAQSPNLPIDPLKNILITPLFASKKSLEIMRSMAEAGRQITFDSGGYYVQTGRIGYDELYLPLLRLYQTHSWASTYVLPDFVPTSQDTPDVVDYKVRATARTSRLFFDELPDDLKARAMPVIHGHTQRQVDICLSTYLSMGAKTLGFGSFGTVGSKSEVNMASQGAISLAKYVIQVSHQHGARVHLFGLGVPALAAMLKGIGADSFDSSSWLKAAGFGQVFLPFMRAHNITYESDASELQRGITVPRFEQLRRATGHECELCRSIETLRSKKMHRAVHNLIVLSETIHQVNHHNIEHIRAIYKAGSQKYQNEVEKWLVS